MRAPFFVETLFALCCGQLLCALRPDSAPPPPPHLHPWSPSPKSHPLPRPHTAGIIPRSMYVFRVRGINKVGPGLWSPCTVAIKTQKTAPLPPGQVKLKASTATLLSLYWSPARPNGFPVTRCVLEGLPTWGCGCE